MRPQSHPIRMYARFKCYFAGFDVLCGLCSKMQILRIAPKSGGKPPFQTRNCFYLDFVYSIIVVLTCCTMKKKLPEKLPLRPNRNLVIREGLEPSTQWLKATKHVIFYYFSLFLEPIKSCLFLYLAILYIYGHSLLFT